MMEFGLMKLIRNENLHKLTIANCQSENEHLSRLLQRTFALADARNKPFEIARCQRTIRSLL